LVLRAKPGLIDPDFLPVFLSSDLFLDRAVQISVGSLSPTVNWKTLATQQFNLPPIDEQKLIANLLWKVEADLESRRLLLGALRQVGEATLEDQVERQLGLAQTRSLGDVCSVTSGVTLGPHRQALPPRPYLRVANVMRGAVTLEEVKHVGATDDEWCRKQLAQGDVLVVEGHASASEVGRAALWDRPEPMLFQNHLFCVRAGEKVLPTYIEVVLNSRYGRSYMRTVAKSTSGLNTINSRALKALPVPVASLEDQKSLVAMRGESDSACRDVEVSLDEIQSLKSTLLRAVWGL
jgi:restriction endonuclease S subunit